jgi:hypothetical protein
MLHVTSITEKEAKTAQHSFLPFCSKDAFGAWHRKDIIKNQAHHYAFYGLFLNI